MKQIKDSQGYVLKKWHNEGRWYLIWDHVGDWSSVGAPYHAKVADQWLDRVVLDAIKSTTSKREHDGAYYWTREDTVDLVLEAIRKSASAPKKWPSWALKAKAAGWKAPKGWRP